MGIIKCEGSPGQHSGELVNDENVIFGVLPQTEMDLWSCVLCCVDGALTL